MSVPSCYFVVMFGARDWTNGKLVEREVICMRDWVALETPHKELVVITGGADGADKLSEFYCGENNVHCAVIRALWKHRHAGAGPQRNGIMAAFVPDEGIGFHKNITKSKGTKDMRNKLQSIGVPCRIVRR